MALTDAFLLEPYPTQVWIEYRTDGLKGSGTQSDPYDGSTQARFDEAMRSLPTDRPIRVQLGSTRGALFPFVTGGFWMSSTGVMGSAWQPRPGMVIAGAGREATYLKLEPGSAADTHYFAIGAPTTSPVDFFEVVDLTIDAGLPATGSVACGAIRVMGNHVRVRNVKVINWGSRTTAQPGYVVALIVADGDPGSPLPRADDAVIEDCIAVLPAAGNTVVGATVNVLHIGGRDWSAGSTLADYGRAPVIRNCFVDGKLGTQELPINPAAGAVLRAVSMTACRGGIVEGNQIHNVWIGGPHQDRQNTADLIVRNNTYRNVVVGAYWKLGTAAAYAGGGGSLTRTGSDLIVIVGSIAGLIPGDWVRLVANPPVFSGVYRVKALISAVPAKFSVEAPLTTETSGSVSVVDKLFSTGRILFEGNHLELAKDQSGGAAAKVDDSNQAVEYLANEVYVRNNKVRYVDSAAPTDSDARLFDLSGVLNVLVTNNVMDTIATNPMSNIRCGAATYSNNRTMDGNLVQGWDAKTGTLYDELETENDLALVLAMFNRRQR